MSSRDFYKFRRPDCADWKKGKVEREPSTSQSSSSTTPISEDKPKKATIAAPPQNSIDFSQEIKDEKWNPDKPNEDMQKGSIYAVRPDGRRKSSYARMRSSLSKEPGYKERSPFHASTDDGGSHEKIEYQTLIWWYATVMKTPSYRRDWPL